MVMFELVIVLLVWALASWIVWDWSSEPNPYKRAWLGFWTPVYCMLLLISYLLRNMLGWFWSDGGLRK
jgi:hypothetical protein